MSRFPTWLIIIVSGTLGILFLLIVIGVIATVTEDTSPPISAPTATPMPTLAPSPEATSIASVISSMINDCADDPICRLEISSDELKEIFERSNVWSLEENEGVGGKRVFTVNATDTALSVLWVDQEGIVFAEIIVAVGTVGSVATQARLSEVISAIVPGPWERCVHCDILSLWASLDMNPAARESPPGFVVNDVAIQLDYVDHDPSVVATLWKLDE